MRDRNLTLIQLNIQLEKNLNLEFPRIQKVLTEAVFVTPTLLEEFQISYPRNFRLLRTLSIIQWYLPEVYHYRIWLDLSEMNFNWLSLKQKIEIKIYLSNKTNCLIYLKESKRFTGNELFGNILKNDLSELKKVLKLSKKSRKVEIPIWRRGYKDKGSRRPSEKWLPDFDFSFTEYQNIKERKSTLLDKTIYRILETLENLNTEKFNV